MTAARLRRANALLALGVLVPAAVIAPAAAASAASDAATRTGDAPSNWWYDRYGVAAAQAAGWTAT